MPWTFAHPAAVLPFRRQRYFSLVGLVVGSLIPDLGYYLRAPRLAEHAHSLWGLILVDLPIAWLILMVAGSLRNSVLNLLPQPHRGALLAWCDPVYCKRWLVSLSILLGALSHLLWDGFTHVSGFFVLQLPWLQMTLFDAVGRTFHVFNVLQHLSTLLGLTYMLALYRAWIKASPVSDKQGNTLRYGIGLGIVVLALLISLPWAYSEATKTGSLQISVWVVQGVIDATVVGLILILGAAYALSAWQR